MKFKALYAVMAAVSTVTVPTLASAAPIATAAKHSPARAITTPLTQPASEKVDGDNAALSATAIVVLIVAVGAIGAGIVAGTSNTSTTPASS